jgi:hypothetical protein
LHCHGCGEPAARIVAGLGGSGKCGDVCKAVLCCDRKDLK